MPVVALSILALLRFSEPRLHRTAQATSLRAHIGLTYRTLTRRGRLLPIVTLSVLTGLILQVVLEFGPLWLVALAAPAVLYGPYWAGLVSSLGLGGLIAGRIHLDRPRTAAAVAALMTMSSIMLATSGNVIVVIAAQIAARPADRGGRHPHLTPAQRRGALHHPRRRGLRGQHLHLDRLPARRPGIRAAQRAPRHPHRRMDDHRVHRRAGTLLIALAYTRTTPTTVALASRPEPVDVPT